MLKVDSLLQAEHLHQGVNTVNNIQSVKTAQYMLFQIGVKTPSQRTMP